MLNQWWPQTINLLSFELHFFFSRHLLSVVPTCCAPWSYWLLVCLLFALKHRRCSSFPCSPCLLFSPKSKGSFYLSSGPCSNFKSIVSENGKNNVGVYRLPSALLPSFPCFECGSLVFRRPRSSKETIPGQLSPIDWVGLPPFSITGPSTLSFYCGLSGCVLTGPLVVFQCLMLIAQTCAFSLRFFLAAFLCSFSPKPSKKQETPGGWLKLQK